MENEEPSTPLMERALINKYLKRDESGFCILELIEGAPKWCQGALDELIENKNNGIKG